MFIMSKTTCFDMIYQFCNLKKAWKHSSKSLQIHGEDTPTWKRCVYWWSAYTLGLTLTQFWGIIRWNFWGKSNVVLKLRIHESNASNSSQIGVETREIWPFEAEGVVRRFSSVAWVLKCPFKRPSGAISCIKHPKAWSDTSCGSNGFFGGSRYILDCL